jgi:hypothetical protein
MMGGALETIEETGARHQHRSGADGGDADARADGPAQPVDDRHLARRVLRRHRHGYAERHVRMPRNDDQRSVRQPARQGPDIRDGHPDRTAHAPRRTDENDIEPDGALQQVRFA